MARRRSRSAALSLKRTVAPYTSPRTSSAPAACMLSMLLLLLLTVVLGFVSCPVLWLPWPLLWPPCLLLLGMLLGELLVMLLTLPGTV
jgi:fatty acid desaturase